MSDTDNIFSSPQDSSGRRSLSEADLMAYFEGKLSPAQQHEVEQWLAEESMEGDALEGLHKLQPQETRASIEKINYRLRKNIADKKHARKPLKTQQHTLIAIVIILLLAVVAYIVIRKSM